MCGVLFVVLVVVGVLVLLVLVGSWFLCLWWCVRGSCGFVLVRWWCVVRCVLVLGGGRKWKLTDRESWKFFTVKTWVLWFVLVCC